MGAWRLAMQAIWWRKGPSSVVLVVAMFATATAAAGPMFLQGGREAVLHDALVSAPSTSGGTGIEVTKDAVGRSGASPLELEVTHAMLGLSLQELYARKVVSLESQTRVLDGRAGVLGRVTVVNRQGVCAQVRIIAGRCIGESSSDEVMVSALDGRRLNWAVGRPILLDAFRDRVGPADSTARRMVLVGTYAPIDPSSGYWFNDTRDYFGGDQRRQEQVQGQPAADRTLEAAFVGGGAFAGVTASDSLRVLVVEDLLLNTGLMTSSRVPRLRTDLDTYGIRLKPAQLNQGLLVEAVNTRVRAVADTAQARMLHLRPPILVVLIELVSLGLFALFIVISAAAEARSGEVALAKLRGLPTSNVLSFGLLETILLLVVAAPLGAGVSLIGMRAAAATLFGAGTELSLDRTVWIAVVTATAGGLVAGLLASLRSLRQNVIEQGRRTNGRRSGRGMAFEAGVMVLLAAALWQLWSTPPQGTAGRVDALALLAPTLLALAGALAGARALPLIARFVSKSTRRTRHLGLFIGSCELSRRPGGTRLLVVLTAAFAITTFSVIGAQVFSANRQDRAATEIGADRVVLVDPYSGVDVPGIVNRLDPSGTQAMTVAQSQTSVSGATSADSNDDSGPSEGPATLLVVDQSRLVSTGFWRSDFAASPLPDVVRGLNQPFPQPKTWRGDMLRMTVSANLICCGSVAGTLSATGSDGYSFAMPLGRLTSGSHVLTIKTPSCVVRLCIVRSLVLIRDEPGAYSVTGDLTIRRLDAGQAGTFQPVDGATDPRRWRPINSETPVEQVTASASGLRLHFAAPSTVRAFGLQAKIPTAIAAVVTAPYRAATGSTDYQVSLPSGLPISIRVTGVANVLPRAGANGILLPLDMLAAATSLSDVGVLPNQVWLNARAGPDFPARLAAAGVTVTGVQSSSERASALARQGPALAVILLLAGAIAAGLLSVGVAMVGLYLIARRRSFELAALQTLGFPSRKVIAAAVSDQCILAGFAVGLGVTLGLLGARLGLPSIPEFADGGTVPGLLIRFDPLRILLVAGIMSAVLGTGIAVSGWLLTSSAGPTRLREGQA
jgi:hypothetical protein